MLAEVPHKIQDLGHRWEQEAGITAQESNVFEVLGGLSSAQHQGQPQVGVVYEGQGMHHINMVVNVFRHFLPCSAVSV